MRALLLQNDEIDEQRHQNDDDKGDPQPGRRDRVH